MAAATHATAAPQQRTLLGTEPCVMTGLVRWSLVGEIKRPAEVRTATDGSTQLIVQVLQPKGALPIVVAFRAPADRCLEQRALAARMPAGTAVLVIGRGLQLTHRDDLVYLAPVHCDNLIPASGDLASTLDACTSEPAATAATTTHPEH